MKLKLKVVRKNVARALKARVRKIRAAEKRGALEKWKTRVGLGIQAFEIAALTAAAVKGARLGNPRATPVKRSRHSTARKRARA